MQKNNRSLWFLFALMLIYLVLRSQNPTPSLEPSTMQTPAPEMSWNDWEGSAHTLKEFSGKPIVLHFWASWCGPCIREFPELIEAARTMPEVIFLTLTSDEKLGAAQGFLTRIKKEEGKPLPKNLLFGWDPDKHITYELFQTAVLPETILIDRNLMLRRKIPGATNWRDPELRKLIHGL